MAKQRTRHRWAQTQQKPPAIQHLPDAVAARSLANICKEHGPGTAYDLAHAYILARPNHVDRTLHVGRLLVRYTIMIVEAHIASNNFNYALSTLNPALKLFRRSSKLHQCMAFLELKRGNKESAEVHAGQACACDPKNTRAAVLYADILRYNHQPERAFDFLYGVAAQEFNHNVMMGLRRLVAHTEIGRKQYDALVDQYYSTGKIAAGMRSGFRIVHDAPRADERHIREIRRGLDPRRLRLGADGRG